MPNIEPLKVEDLPEFVTEIQFIEQRLGFVPNSLLTMGRRPDILCAFMALLKTVVAPAKLRPDPKQLIAHVASTAAGCRYFKAHTAGTAGRIGVPVGKLEAVWNLETDTQFDVAKQAALRLGRDAGSAPNLTTPEHFDKLRRYFKEEEIVEMVAMISLFGFLNRWNDTIGTQLEDEHLQFASRQLSEQGWQVGNHA